MAGPRIGVIGAMAEEIRTLAEHIAGVERIETLGRREFHLGSLFGVDVVFVQSRIGKVAAASTATHLVDRFGVRTIVFTGVAGALAHGLAAGDLVVADRLRQHDLDASPIFPAMQVPLLGVTDIACDPHLVALAEQAADEHAREVGTVARTGLIVSGDRFVSTSAERDAIIARCPEALCVEMEGAAVAQVCHEHGVGFVVVRTISDSADDDATEHFTQSLPELAGASSLGVVSRLLPAIARGR